VSGRRVELDAASAGMVLAEALLDGHGAVLLPSGATLSEATLASLRRRGVEHCCVLEAAAAADPAALARQRQHDVERLARLFRHHPAEAAAGAEAGGGAELLRLLTAYRLGEAP
jgi:hypothetical protein